MSIISRTTFFVVFLIVFSNLFAGFTIEKLFEGDNSGIDFDVINDSMFVIGDQIIDSKGKEVSKHLYGSWFSFDSDKAISGIWGGEKLFISDLDGKNEVRYDLPVIYNKFDSKVNNDFIDAVQINDTLFLVTDYWKSGGSGQKYIYPVMINKIVLPSEQIRKEQKENTFYVKDNKKRIYKVNTNYDNGMLKFVLSSDQVKYPEYKINILNPDFYATREFIIDKYYIVAIRYGVFDYPEKQKHELYAFDLKTGKYLNKTILPSIFDYSNTNYVAFNNSIYYYLMFNDKYNVYKMNFDENKSNKQILLDEFIGKYWDLGMEIDKSEKDNLERTLEQEAQYVKELELMIEQGKEIPYEELNPEILIQLLMNRDKDGGKFEDYEKLDLDTLIKLLKERKKNGSKIEDDK